jgi:hypothetical protein
MKTDLEIIEYFHQLKEKQLRYDGKCQHELEIALGRLRCGCLNRKCFYHGKPNKKSKQIINYYLDWYEMYENSK